jgi:hypothetical protein
MKKMEVAPLHEEYYNGDHLLLKSNEKCRWREQLIDIRWLHTNEDKTYREIISCNKIVRLRKTLVEFLHKVKGKWPDEMKKWWKTRMKLAEVST